MSAAGGLAKRSHEENWLPILELAIEEVFEIMLGCQVKGTGGGRARRDLQHDHGKLRKRLSSDEVSLAGRL